MHGTRGDLCEECRKLLDYTDVRIDKCVFGARKPTCAKCALHCYKKDMRERIKEVMRHAGPKMAYKTSRVVAAALSGRIQKGGTGNLLLSFAKKKVTKENGT